MDSYRIEFDSEAAEMFRSLDLFERQIVWDFVENLKLGKIPEAEFLEGNVAYVIVGRLAVGYYIDQELKRIEIVDLEPAD